MSVRQSLADFRIAPESGRIADIGGRLKSATNGLMHGSKQHARADAPADFVLFFVHGVAGLSVRVLAHRLPSAIP